MTGHACVSTRRASAIRLPDAEGHASLVAVGDSFTFCTTVQPEDTWTAVLGRRFDLSAEDLGVPRLGVFEYLEVLEADRRCRKHRPWS